MKVAIIYYSFTGNTRKIAERLKEKLATHFEVDIIPLEVVREEKRFLHQAKQAFLKQKVILKDTNFDLSSYSLICMGSPVWAFQPAPAVRTFLKKTFGLAGKKAIIFLTFGSGLGVNRCIKTLIKILARKGALVIKTFTYPQAKIEDNEEIEKRIEDLVNEIK